MSQLRLSGCPCLRFPSLRSGAHGCRAVQSTRRVEFYLGLTPRRPQLDIRSWRLASLSINRRGSRVGGGGAGAGAHPWDGRTRGFPRLKGRKKGPTPFRHNMAINILKSCKSVFAYVKNRSFPSHIRSSFPWRPLLAEILDPRLIKVVRNRCWYDCGCSSFEKMVLY